MIMSALDDAIQGAEIGLCVLLAASDGEVSDREIGALSSRLAKILGEEFPAVAVGVIVDTEIDRMSRLGPERYIGSLVQRLPEERRRRALRGALVVAAADGLAPEEERMFRDVATELGIDDAAAEAMLDEVRHGIPSS
jgi:tellurite resistance protein